MTDNISGVSYYQVERDGVVLPQQFSSPSFTDTVLTGSHSYRVRAVDASGNLGDWSALVNATAAAPGAIAAGASSTRLLGEKLLLPDSILHCAMRAPWGTPYAGGQVGGADLDLAVWNENNAYAPHRGKPTWGVWGESYTLPTITAALNLSIAEATAYEGRDEIARVPAGVPLRLKHGVLKDDRNANAAFGKTIIQNAIGWIYEWVNCQTGAVVNGSYSSSDQAAPPGSVSGQSVPATALAQIVANASAGSYLLRVRALTVRATWNGLPTDYAQVSGSPANPAQYKWTGATGITYYYDPIWNVGAVPYDPAHPLRVAHAAAVLSGTTKKNPAWASQLIAIGADGLPQPQSGEWSALKVVVGNGQWIGDVNCHPNACFPSLWKLEGALSTQVVVNPRIRAVGALANRDGSMWLGGMLAGRSGPQPFLARYDNPNQAPFSTTKPVPLWSIYCECNLLAAKMVNSISWPNGILHATTPCDSIIYDVAQDKLIDTHPGGRCGGALRIGTNRDLWVKTSEGGDFAGSNKFPFSWATIVAGEPGQEKIYRGAPHHVLAALGYKSTVLYYIEDQGLKPVAGTQLSTRIPSGSGSPTPTNTTPPVRLQALGRFNGQSRDLVAQWDTSRFDLAHIGVCGQYVFAFGHTQDFKPACARLDTAGVDPLFRSFATNLHPRNIATVLSSDGKKETLLLVAKEVDADGLPQPGWGVYELKDPAPKLCFFWNADARKFSVARSVADASGIDLKTLPLYLLWMPTPGTSGGGQWLPKTGQPTAGTWLQLLPFTNTVISYSLPAGQAIPYSTGQFDTMCWDGLSMQPNTSCTDAACALSRMPPGTVVSVLQWPELGQTLDYPVSLTDLGGVVSQPNGQNGGGRVLDELYPWLWISSDGILNLPREPGMMPLSQSDLAALAEFNVRARGWNRHTALPLTAQTRVRACLLIPPGFHVREKALKQVG